MKRLKTSTHRLLCIALTVLTLTITLILVDQFCFTVRSADGLDDDQPQDLPESFTEPFLPDYLRDIMLRAALRDRARERGYEYPGFETATSKLMINTYYVPRYFHAVMGVVCLVLLTGAGALTWLALKKRKTLPSQ